MYDIFAHSDLQHSRIETICIEDVPGDRCLYKDWNFVFFLCSGNGCAIYTNIIANYITVQRMPGRTREYGIR